MSGSVHKHGARIELYRNSFLRSPDIKPEDKELVETFVNEYGTAKNHSARTSSKYYNYFKSVLIFLDVPVQDMTHKDYIAFRTALKNDILRKTGSRTGVKFHGEVYSESSKHDFDMILRKILKWYKKRASREQKDEIDKILEEPVYRINQDKIEEPDVFTEEEILQMIKVSHDLRDKAMIVTLWETGARASELLTLQVGDIQPLQYNNEDKGLLLRMRRSKTTKRTVPLIESAPYMQAYLNQHPFNGDPSKPLWLQQENVALSYDSMRKLIRTAARRAKIEKRIYNHLFRHSRATYLANKGWSEAQLCAWFGWTIGSDMPATYIRRSGINLTDKALEMHGMKPAENGGKAALLPKSCYFCQHPNPQTHEYCEKCQKPLDPTKIAAAEKNANDMIEALVETKLKEIMSKHGLVEKS